MAALKKIEGKTRSDTAIDGTSAKPMPGKDPQEVSFYAEFVFYCRNMCRSVNLMMMEMTTAPIPYLLEVLMQHLIQFLN